MLRSVAALVMIALLVAACKEQEPMAVSIQETKARHADTLMATPGVVSVGIGRDEHGAEIIIVGLDRDDVALKRQVPEKLDGYEVRTQVVGRIRAD